MNEEVLNLTYFSNITFSVIWFFGVLVYVLGFHIVRRDSPFFSFVLALGRISILEHEIRIKVDTYIESCKS